MSRTRSSSISRRRRQYGRQKAIGRQAHDEAIARSPAQWLVQSSPIESRAIAATGPPPAGPWCSAPPET
jgi:hypothetical protein